MRYKTVDVLCSKCGAEREDVLVAVSSDGENEVVERVECECGEEMTIRVGAPRAIFANGFFAHDRPRRIGVEFTDEDGKVHRKDLTHKVNLNEGGGVY